MPVSTLSIGVEMIHQSVTTQTPFMVPQYEHAQLAASLAQVFGNSQTRELEPADQMMFIVENHDRGWDSIDLSLSVDASTGLPYNLVKTPIAELIRTGPDSVAFCEKFHPYAGLLVSMHSYGLWTGRYGLSDKVVVEHVPEEERLQVQAMLNDELKRQQRLRDDLSQDLEFKDWITDERLFYNYKRLQFFDTLALYFNSTCDAEREQSKFINVPFDYNRDETVVVSRLDKNTYGFSPFPFYDSGIEVSFHKHQVKPQSTGQTFASMKSESITLKETIALVSLHS